GYIYVASGSVDPEVAPLSTGRTSASEKFLVTASAQLRGGTNIVICPEGNSTDTENSPLPFRSGAFRLAAAADPEPLIVPIAVANFDKKLTSTTLVAVVHEPFRISSHIGTDPSPDALREFVRDYQQTFHGYVQEARALGLGS
ncbi:MAG: 1-acyl-sn-glycerol-3-phosphate acyltransferase, partial [Candidatus Nanopelagicales bacterium]|nr:1-acyl-sn-glycerol-3-phosphate acyltransferase [Candidatus Nanopelagicales bacterium]